MYGWLIVRHAWHYTHICVDDIIRAKKTQIVIFGPYFSFSSFTFWWHILNVYIQCSILKTVFINAPASVNPQETTYNPRDSDTGVLTTHPGYIDINCSLAEIYIVIFVMLFYLFKKEQRDFSLPLPFIFATYPS